MPNILTSALQQVGMWFRSAAGGFVSIADLDRWMDHVLGYGGIPSAAGVVVNEHTCLGYNPVLAAANIISQELASLPLELFEMQGDSKVLADRPEAYKLKFEPNPLMSSYTWRQTTMGHVVWRGNAYTLIDWDGAGRLRALWPLHPDRVKLKFEGSELWYYVRKQTGEWQPIPAEDMLHIRGLSGDGITGYSIIRLLADSLGIPIAAERFAARYFANDATPGVILKHPKTLTKAAHENIRESFEARHKGVDNSHVLGIIEEGMDAVQLEVRADQSQLLETRRFGVEDVARITRVPLHMLADLTRSTNNNIEHQGLEFGRHCMRPWTINWQQELNRKLFAGTPYFPEFDLSELYRGDAKSRAEANQIKFQNGVLNIDEWRRDDGRNPLPNSLGKVRIVPLNMQMLPGTGAPEMPKPAPAPMPTQKGDGGNGNQKAE